MSTTLEPSRQAYEPPNQSRGGQILDSVIILVLLFGVLFGVTYITESGADEAPPPTKSLSQLPLTDGERTAYQRVIDQGLADQQAVSTMVQTQQPTDNKYPINLLKALLTFGVIGLYLWFVFAISSKQYREVIAERFGPKG